MPIDWARFGYKADSCPSLVDASQRAYCVDYFSKKGGGRAGEHTGRASTGRLVSDYNRLSDRGWSKVRDRYMQSSSKRPQKLEEEEQVT